MKDVLGTPSPNRARLAVSACPLCGHRASECRSSIPGRVRCPCGMVFRPTSAANVSRSEFWDDGDYADSTRAERLYGGRRVAANRALVEQLSALVEGRRWLDVGCGPGFLLREAKRAGWEAFGIDLSRRAVALAREAGLDVAWGDFPNSAPEGTYEVISLIHALEYLPDPRRIVRECRKRLRPHGALVVQSKNLSFWRYGERFLRARSGVWCPQDLCSYSPATLTTLLRMSGFERVTIRSAELPGRRMLTMGFALLVQLSGRVLSPSMTVIAQGAWAR